MASSLLAKLVFPIWLLPSSRLFHSVLLLLILFPWIASPATRSSRRLRPRVISAAVSGCEPVNLNMCRSTMPYSRTRMPNLLDHATQRNARLVLDQYRPLVATRCGVDATTRDDYLAFFLCSVFAPICPSGFDLTPLNVDGSPPARRSRLRHDRGGDRVAGGRGSPLASVTTIPPCRGVCERARAGCEPVMRRYNVSWPEELDCSRWPTQDRGVCIAPESIVGMKRVRSSDHQTIDCQCDRNFTRVSSRSSYLQQDFDFVLHATYRKLKRSTRDKGQHQVTTIRFRVHEVFQLSTSSSSGSRGGSFNASNLVNRSVAFQLVDCRPLLCVSESISPAVSADSAILRRSFRPGQDYLVMGHLSEAGGGGGGDGAADGKGREPRRRLQLDSRSVVETWKKNWPVHLKNWEKRRMRMRQTHESETTTSQR